MVSSEARIEIDTPSRYLGQLCKHFQHKAPVTLEENTGSIQFPIGLFTGEATESELILRVTTEDAAVLPNLQDVVARHLLRFAFRAPPVITWTPAA